MTVFFALFSVSAAFGVHEDSHGRRDPSTYEADVFGSPERYTTPSNLLQRNKGSFLETKSFFRPFSTLEEAKSAEVHLQQAEEQLADKQQITRSKIEVFKQELENQIVSAQKEKKAAEDRIARRGGLGSSSSSFTQIGSPDFEARELDRVSKMQREWKQAADRLGHLDLNAIEPNAKLVEANSRVDADRKRMKRITEKIDEDMQKVENDASLVAADQERLKKEQAERDLH
jgi:hypothetical protein